jgi:hypothetical protein
MDHAIPLGELEQLVELLLRRVGVDVKAKMNEGAAHRCTGLFLSALFCFG